MSKIIEIAKKPITWIISVAVLAVGGVIAWVISSKR